MEREPLHFHEDRWSATITELPPRRLGSLSVNRIGLRFEGEDGELERLKSVLERKMTRIGG